MLTHTCTHAGPETLLWSPRPSYQGGRGPPSMEALACLGLPEAAVPGAKQGHDGLCIPCGSGEGSLAARAREQARPPSTCSLGAHAVFGAGLAAPPTSLQTGFGGRVRPLVAARRQRKARVLQEHRLSRVTASRLPREVDLLHPRLGRQGRASQPMHSGRPRRLPGSWIQSRQQEGPRAQVISGPKPLGSIEGVPAGTGSCWPLPPPPQSHQLSQPGSR